MARYQKVHQRIEVSAIFKPGKKPQILSFLWDGRSYEIRQVNMINRLFKGENFVFIFSVSNSNGAYQLRFDTDNLNWWLEQIYWEE